MGEKQGPVNCWFPDAAKAGAKFIEGYKVKKVLFDDTGKNVAVGVTGTWASRGKDKGVDAAEADKIFREVVVKAKKVIVSSGTLWSPVVLKNSGLTVGRAPNWLCTISLHLFLTESMDWQESASPSRQRPSRLLQARRTTMGRWNLDYSREHL